MLFDLLPLPPHTVRHIFARRGDMIQGTYVTRQEQVDRWIATHLDWNVYVTLNASKWKSRVRRRPRASDIAYIQGVLFDLDPVGERPQPLDATNELLPYLPPGCNVVLDSGRGAQVWCLHPPIEPTPERVGKIAAYVHRVARKVGEVHGCRVDTSCSDPARLARMPDSINQKTGHPVRILATPLTPPWAWIDDLPAEPVPQSRPAGKVPPGCPFSTILVRATRAAGDFLQFGQVEPGRHARCFATVKSLHEVGVEPQQALQLLLRGASLCTPPLAPAEARRIYTQVYEGDL